MGSPGKAARGSLGSLGTLATIFALIAALGSSQARPAGAQTSAWSWSIEAKGHQRESDLNRFPVPFPFLPAQLPPGQTQAFFGTVDPGSHTELSVVTLQLDGDWGRRGALRVKVDGIDLYDRNPTSTDNEVDVDELWFRFGPETGPGFLPESGGFYVKAGKFGKFERQDDRHLESYGLAATAFNRFEDSGVEAGVDLGRRFYVKASYTTGNPLFLRDPNALAGDNGTPERRRTRPDTVPELGAGIPILYDAEIEDFDLGSNAELGVALGVRLGGETADRAAEFQVWAYQRELAERVELNGTFYGGDLDLINGPAPGFGLPLVGDDKEEVGANLWVYLGGLSFFGQYVDQEVAGMARLGYDAELAWAFELPLFWSAGGKQILPSIQPAVRFSHLDPDFVGGSPNFPAPSLRWEWDKLDYGLRVTIVEGLDLTYEQSDNEFILGNGSHRTNDETLLTLRYKFQRP